jgi:hypothetical protein
MKKHLARTVALLLLAIAFAMPAAAQSPAEPTASLSSPTAPDKPERPIAAPGMVAAFLSTLLIMFIICKPARKT